jgi:hypothetical protein
LTAIAFVGASLLAMLLICKDRQQELGVPLAPTVSGLAEFIPPGPVREKSYG